MNLRLLSFSVAPLGAMLMTACFSPDPAGDGDAGTETDSGGATTASDTSTSEPGSSATSNETSMNTSASATEPTPTSEGSSESGADSTGPAVDEPPTVELRVKGSTTPAPQSSADLIPLTAEATDDDAVVRVEFYAGDTLLATDESEPYEAELLLTSADAGSLQLRAVAYDGRDQSAQSEVSLDVNVIGGAIQAQLTDLLLYGGLPFQPGGGTAVDADGNILVAATSLNEEGTELSFFAAQLSPDLETIDWNVQFPAGKKPSEPNYLTMGKPALVPDGTQLRVGGSLLQNPQLIPNVSMLTVDTVDPTTPTLLSIPADPDAQFFSNAGIAIDPSGNTVVYGPDEFLTKFGPDDAQLWQEPTGVPFSLSSDEVGGYRLYIDDAGDIYLDDLSCAFSKGTTCIIRTRKVDGASGALLWAESIERNGTTLDHLYLGGSAINADATQLAVAYGEESSVRVVLRDGDGTLTNEFSIDDDGVEYFVSDIAYDAQGQLVIYGTRITPPTKTNPGARDAMLWRVSTSGDVLWQRAFGFNTDADDGHTLTLDRRGRAVVTGFGDRVAGFIIGARLWVAIVDL